MAEERHETFTTALHRAIATESYLRRKIDNGAKIIIREKNKKLKELVLR